MPTTTIAWSSGTTYYASAFDNTSVNGMQVAMDITWSAVSEGSSTAVATVKMYTDNRYAYDDNQVLTISSNLGSDYSFNNTSGTSEVLRVTRTYTHTYTAGSYNTSPGSLTFTIGIDGAYDGANPNLSVTGIVIPARPSHPPTAPRSVSATPGNGFISVSFAGPSDGGTGGVAYYQKSSNNSTWSTATNPFTITGTNGTTTTGYVRAVSNYGGAGPSASASAVPRTVPTAPTSFAANANTFGQISLSWGAPSSNGGATVTSYVVRNGTTVLQDSSATSYTHTGLSPYTDYSYTVTAKNAAGEGAAASLTVKSLGGIAKVWNGTTWVTTLPKVWNGTAWLDSQARMYDGVGATEDAKWKHGI